MDPTIESRLNSVAAAQAGHLTRRQLLGAGLSRATILRRTRSGLFVQDGRDVFRLGSSPATHEGHVLAACLDTGGVASHWTAAELHGLVDRRPIVDITVRKGRTLRVARSASGGPPLRIHSSTNLPTGDCVQIGPIPVTNVARTMLGLGALVPRELSEPRFLELVSKVVDDGLATDPWLWWLLARRRCRGRNGVIALETALAARARLGPTESWLEREVLRLLDRGGVPLPSTQRVVRRSGRFAARVDFLYETERIVMEALGYAFHRTPAQIEADTRRANLLQLEGFEVYQFTARQVVDDPGSVVTTARTALARKLAGPQRF